MTRKKQLQDEILAHLSQVKEISAKAEAESRDFNDEERSRVTELLAKANTAKEELKKLKGDDELRKAISALGDDIGLTDTDPTPADPTPAGKGRSIGEQFVESDSFKSFLKQFPGGRIPEKTRVQSQPVQIGGLKTILGSGGVTDGVITPDTRGLLDGILFRPFTIRDVITIGNTESDTVEFVRENTRTNAAAPVAEATGATEGSGGIKPESAFSLEKVTETVKTIAHWIPATKRVLSDAGQVRTLIDNFLRDGLTEELEEQVVNGAGTGENFTGILNTSGIQTQPFDSDILRTARKARTKVRTVGRAVATAYLMHPNDWEAYDLLKDDQGRYYFGGPLELGTPRLWGLPVVESEAVPEGEPLVGDFRKAVLWDREQTTISVSDSHSNFFVRNLVAILAELRAAFGVIRPAAFVQFDVTAS